MIECVECKTQYLEGELRGEPCPACRWSSDDMKSAIDRRDQRLVYRHALGSHTRSVR